MKEENVILEAYVFGIEIIEVKEGVKIEIFEYSEQHNSYLERWVIVYNDGNRFDFGHVLVASDAPYTEKGYYVYNDKYVYMCSENEDIVAIFDIDNRTEIDDADKKDELYDQYLNRNNSSLSFIRSRNMLNN